MAGNYVGEAVYKITYDANTGELTAKLNDAEKKISKSADTTEAKQSKAFKSIEKGAIVAGAAIGAFAKSSVDVGIEFDSAMSKVAAISGATGSELQALRDKAKEMGMTTKFSASESAQALTYMAMAGWKTEDMLNGLEGIMSLAAASGEDLATTSDIVTDALTAFGYSAKDAGHFADVLAVASSNSNTNVGMMGETFKYVGAAAGALGYSAEDTALAIGLMANAGIKASQAGTELNAIFTRLSTDTNGARKAIEELGIQFFNADGSARNFTDVLDEMRVATAKMTDEEKINFANKVAGQSAQAGLLAMLNATTTDYDSLTAAIKNSDGASKEMSDTMLNNTGGALTLLKSQFEGLQLEIAEKLAPAVQGLISGLSEFVNWLSENQWVFPTITAGISAILALGLVMKIMSLITTISALSGPVKIITLAATAFAFVATLIMENWEGISQFFGGLFEGIGNIVKGAWEGIINGAKGAWEGIKSIFKGLANFFGSIFSNAWNAVKKVFSVGGKIFDGIKDGIVNAFKNIVNGIIGGINKVVAIPFNAINGALSGLRGINILGVSPFGWLPKIGVPQIPKLATGGIVESKVGGSLIVAGEGGQDEWVVPESKMASLIDQLNARGAGMNVTINVSGTFATSTSEQRKVAETIAQRIQEIQQSRLLNTTGVNL